jgi:signal transduction histidine kinase
VDNAEQRLADVLGRVEELAPKLAHDLRGALNAVSGYADLLALESVGPLNPRQKRFVEEIRAGTQKAQREIDICLERFQAVVRSGAKSQVNG